MKGERHPLKILTEGLALGKVKSVPGRGWLTQSHQKGRGKKALTMKQGKDGARNIPPKDLIKESISKKKTAFFDSPRVEKLPKIKRNGAPEKGREWEPCKRKGYCESEKREAPTRAGGISPY